MNGIDRAAFADTRDALFLVHLLSALERAYHRHDDYALGGSRSDL